MRCSPSNRAAYTASEHGDILGSFSGFLRLVWRVSRWVDVASILHITIDWFALVVTCLNLWWIRCTKVLQRPEVALHTQDQFRHTRSCFTRLKQPFATRPPCVICRLQLIRASILPTPTTAARSIHSDLCEPPLTMRLRRLQLVVMVVGLPYYCLYSFWLACWDVVSSNVCR